MGRSFLSIIAENERRRLKEKNIEASDDVLNSSFKEYLDDYGRFAAQNYQNDSNFESPTVTEVGQEALQDLKDLNVFPQDEYEQVNVNLNDSSVIDMPEIDEISEQIYLNNIVYNKFANLQYIPYTAELPTGPIEQLGSYGDFIEEIKQNCITRGSNLADIFTGVFNSEDSPLGQIGATALNVALNLQFATNLQRKTLGKINTQLFSVLQTGTFIRADFDITVRAQPLARAAEFLSELQGFEFPLSYLPPDVFGLERLQRVDSRGVTTYIGGNLTYEQRTQLLLQYTGKGQQSVLINLLKLNKYKAEVQGKFETLPSNEYIRYEGNNSQLNAKDFVVSGLQVQPTKYAYYEAYGIESLNLLTRTGDRFSDKFRFVWLRDLTNDDAVGWTDRNTTNPFNPKSLLFQTQEILNGEGGTGAFLDMNDKTFLEVVNGETLTISRGDATTASGDYTHDDGTFVPKGDVFRVWTKKRGYNKLSRTLRHRNLDNGDTRSVLNENGLINFAPTIREASNPNNNLVSDDVIKRYMFSLENLAWNDHMNDLPLCEQGVGDPVTGHRGRIMWFPPYNLKVTENVTANWEQSDFIGRGEPIWTYNNSTREGTINFTIIVDHPDIVHQLVGSTSEFWERYFKGDKLVQDQARAQRLINKKLNQNEIDEIEKRRKQLQPKKKKDNEPKVTPRKKEEEENKKTKELEDDGTLGEVIFSVYFPNDEFTLPTAPFIDNPAGLQSDNLVPNQNLTFREVRYGNIGYEDGGASSDFEIFTTDNYRIETAKSGTDKGIRYTKYDKTRTNAASSAANGGFSYKKGKLRDRRRTNQVNCTNPPKGYPDKTNFGLNDTFYFKWKEILLGKLNGVSKARVTIVGNASGAIPTGISNTGLASNRAKSVSAWFDRNVPVYLDSIFVETEITKEVTAKSDSEDADLEAAGLPFCDDCDKADKRQCKNTRRVDVYVKVLEEDEPDDPVTPVTGNTTIDDTIDEGQVTPDTDEDTDDPDDVDPLPPLDPAILKKLVYTECDFFRYLEINDPAFYQTISERIKYFAPAFHSITPQGFNSRLTFLQQCMRQADSIGKDGVDNWKNLAFGRPPVCIMRVGDFYHCRIIITSLSIDYGEGMQWDMNPEGIGVQPMYADITLNIKLLGGSSMSGPINRLQNALDFNYYANTEQYDARADSIVFVDKSDDANFPEGGDPLGVLKNGRIVDGIRLSTITNFSGAEQTRRLAQLRKDSRVFLQNSTETPAEDVENLGEVESLLELKKRLGVPMTEDEKIDKKVDDNTKGKFQMGELDTPTTVEASKAIDSSLRDQGSLLSQTAQQALADGLASDDPLVLSNFKQFLELSVTDSSEITDEYVKQVSEEYFDAYKKTYID